MRPGQIDESNGARVLLELATGEARFVHRISYHISLTIHTSYISSPLAVEAEGAGKAHDESKRNNESVERLDVEFGYVILP